MTVHNDTIADAFDEMADLLSIRGENSFRIRAYRRAAQLVRTLPRELAQTPSREAIDSLPGIGADLTKKIMELLDTGHLRALQAARRGIPSGVRELLSLPMLGPARVRALHTELGVQGPQDLRRALADGRVDRLRGFGPVIQRRLAEALSDSRLAQPRRTPIHVAAPYAESLRSFLLAVPGVTQVEVAGSYRRGRDTVADLDLLVCATRQAAPVRALAKYEEFAELTAAGSTKAAGVLRNGLQVDVRVVPPASFGTALHYFTGNREHNIRLRRRAQERGYKLNEYGLFRAGRRIAGATEQGLFAALGLPWIAPELREDRGEIEAAEAGTLPRLVERRDLQGDLHVHTNASDGADSLPEMAAAARARGLRYIAITDHSKHLGVTHGLDPGRLARQMDAIDALNAQRPGLTVLKGVEVDILENGGLALSDALLARLDVVVVAVHSAFALSEQKQTARILRALDRPHVSILAHPFGRLLGERPPYALDFERILDAARERGCFLEINAQPMRLDLDDVHAKAARDRGVLLSIASDAHAGDQFDHLELGVRQARRAWLDASQVLNARPLPALRSLLRAGAQSVQVLR